MNRRRQDIVTLFGAEPSDSGPISGLALSGILHLGAAAPLVFGLLHVPRIREPIVTEHYSLRHLELHSPEVQDRAASQYGDAASAARAALAEQIPAAALPDLPHATPGKQTLLQPQFRTRQTLAVESPIPSIMIWTPELVPVKQIVAPVPEKPTVVEAKPSADLPNTQTQIAEHSLAPADREPKIPTPSASSSSPVALKAVSLVHLPPATVSNSTRQPTPTSVLSISEVRMDEGTVMLPPVNETQSLDLKGTAMVRPAAVVAPAKAPVAAQAGNAASAAPSASVGDLNGTAQGTTEHVQLPRDGKFNFVVVGTSLAEQYPEILQIWSSRVAYTAYLHVGTARNWILQYAQLRFVDTAANGTTGRLEAPWPYDIFCPNLANRDLNGDALLIHGILNESGRLESLAIAFPAQFPRAAFVLNALKQWQFRPAFRQGKATAVEVLLIIPEESD